MKKINFLLIVLLQVFAFQAIGQSDLNDGRAMSAVPSTPQATETVASGDKMVNGSDFDIPGQATQSTVEADDLVFPVDFDILREELNASASSQAVVEKVNGMAKQIEALVQANEQLRQENKIIRQSLSTCCASSDLGLNASDAYLLQNAPNPFSSNSEIKYFVPENLTNAILEIRDIKSNLIKSYDLDVKGYGKVNIGDQIFGSGTFIYSLIVNGEIIDSKVMILTK